METPKPLSVSKNSVYNLVGTIVFCFCQWITSALLVVHLSPDGISIRNTGLLQLAISVTNIFFSISCYNMRTYQISDVKNKYSYGDYVGLRIITASVAMVLCAVYLVGTTCLSNFAKDLFPKYSAKEIACVLIYMLFKLNETFSDVLHAVNQKNYRMDYVGVSLCVRGVVSVILFAGAMVIFGDLLISILIMAIGTLSVVWFYDVEKSKQFGSIRPQFNKTKIKELLIGCLPAVIASAAFIAITTIPRQTLESMRGMDSLGYYGTIATPLVVVQVMATSVFNPMLTQLAEDYSENNTQGFIKRIIKSLALLFGMALVVCVGVVLCGEFAVGLVFGSKFVPYTNLMYGIIGCTTMYVISWLCTNTLIIMRKLKVCMVASVTALGIALLIARQLIDRFEMNGVSFSIMIAYAVHIVVCITIICKNLKLKRKEK